MDPTLTFTLIHSPLVGPLTWRPVAQALAERGYEVLVPALDDQPGSGQPFWQQHAGSLARSLAPLSPERRLVLVAHSGAGPLLPVIGAALAQPIAAYLFVDAGIPRAGHSRLDLMRLQDGAWAGELHRALRRRERFPAWQEEALRALIPDDDLRRQMVAEIRPRALPFFTEPIPVPARWPDAPCGYIRFSSSYAWDARQAEQAGWPVREVEAGHFHMLVDPDGVAALLLDLLAELEARDAG